MTILSFVSFSSVPFCVCFGWHALLDATLGKGGSKIKEIRESTGCSIQVASDMLPNSTEREVKLTGTAEQITQCIFHICCVMLEVIFKLPPFFSLTFFVFLVVFCFSVWQVLFFFFCLFSFLITLLFHCSFVMNQNGWFILCERHNFQAIAIMFITYWTIITIESDK